MIKEKWGETREIQDLNNVKGGIVYGGEENGGSKKEGRKNRGRKRGKEEDWKEGSGLEVKKRYAQRRKEE